MEQKGKTYEELNPYERSIANASLEQRLEVMAKELRQIAQALQISVHVDATFHDWKDEQYASACVTLIKKEACTRRDVKETGDLFGIIEESKAQ